VRWCTATVTAVLGVAVFAACTGSGAGTASAREALGDAYVAEPDPGLVTAAQPGPAQVADLRRLGYRRFISLRPADEPGAGWEEAEFTDGDARFVRIPISGAGDLTRENVETLERVLVEAGGEGAVLYCASSNRVGALLALRAHWLQGAEPEAALELGRRAGLAALEPAVRELLAGGS